MTQSPATRRPSTERRSPDREPHARERTLVTDRRVLLPRLLPAAAVLAAGGLDQVQR